MLIDSNSETAISNLGWVDKGALWVFSRKDNTVKSINIGKAKYLTLKLGSDDTFAVVHHFDSDRFEITAHSFSEPGRIISRISMVAPQNNSIEGDLQVWSFLPRFYTSYAFGSFNLFSISPNGDLSMQEYEWFNDSYDKGYQGVIDVVEVSPDILIVSVQRDSCPILYDYSRKILIRKIQLADRRGNPTFQIFNSDLWTVDYDTVVRLDGRTFEVKKFAEMQSASVNGMRHFVGGLTFSTDGRSAALARPFSGDVLLLDPSSLRVTHDLKLNGQPLSVGLFAEEFVAARDWKSGKLLTGKLKKKNW